MFDFAVTCVSLQFSTMGSPAEGCIQVGGAQSGMDQALAAYFGDERKQGGGKGAAFLQHFLAQRLWAEEGDDAGDSAGLLLAEKATNEVPDSDADEEFLNIADDFERNYNFRCGPRHTSPLRALVLLIDMDMAPSFWPANDAQGVGLRSQGEERLRRTRAQ
jgi:hypothetical protein